MNTLVLILYIFAAVSFAVAAWTARSLIALGLLFWVLVFLVPLIAK